LNHRFDLLLSSGYKYIESNEITNEIKDSMSSTSAYKFLTNEELLKVALRQKKELIMYRMTHKEISKDTIDVNFSQLSLIVKRKIH